jgi:hypothetical protein
MGDEKRVRRRNGFRLLLHINKSYNTFIFPPAAGAEALRPASWNAISPTRRPDEQLDTTVSILGVAATRAMSHWRPRRHLRSDKDDGHIQFVCLKEP